MSSSKWIRGSRTAVHELVEVTNSINGQQFEVDIDCLEIYKHRYNPEIGGNEEEVLEVLNVEVINYHEADDGLLDQDLAVHFIDNLSSGDWLKILYN